MISVEAVRALAVGGGILVGYGAGRWLWLRRGLVFSYWTAIVVIIVAGLASERLLAALGLTTAWQLLVFPWLVGLGVGLSVTSARPPRHAAWWQLWKE